MYPEITQLFVATHLPTVISLKAFLTPDINTSLSNLGSVFEDVKLRIYLQTQIWCKEKSTLFHILQLYVLAASILFIK